MTTIAVMRRSDADVQAEADLHWRGDTEKVPTTPIKSLTFLGIRLTSRYGKHREYEAMAEIIGELAPEAISSIAAISCDSKATWAYTIELKAADRALATSVGRAFCDAAFAVRGGHNDVCVEFEGTPYFSEGGDWDIDDCG